MIWWRILTQDMLSASFIVLSNRIDLFSSWTRLHRENITGINCYTISNVYTLRNLWLWQQESLKNARVRSHEASWRPPGMRHKFKVSHCSADCSALLLNQNCSVEAGHCVSGTCDEQVVQHYFCRRIKAGARCFYDAKKHGPLKNKHSHYWLIHFELALHHILHPF